MLRGYKSLRKNDIFWSLNGAKHNYDGQFSNHLWSRNVYVLVLRITIKNFSKFMGVRLFEIMQSVYYRGFF